jgi:hypothetical protein
MPTFNIPSVIEIGQVVWTPLHAGKRKDITKLTVEVIFDFFETQIQIIQFAETLPITILADLLVPTNEPAHENIYYRKGFTCFMISGAWSQ